MATETFPLIPRRRVIGLAFGGIRSVRRGSGSDVAGSRRYVPGRQPRLDRLGSVRPALRRTRQRRVHRPRVLRRRGSARRDGRRPEAFDGDSALATPAPRQARSPAREPAPDPGERARDSQPHCLPLPTMPAARRPGARRAASASHRRAAWRGARSTRRTTPSRAASSTCTSTGGSCRRRRSSSSSLTSWSCRTSSAWQRTLEHRWELVPVVIQDPVWSARSPTWAP